MDNATDVTAFSPIIQEMLLSNIVLGPSLTSVDMGGLEPNMYRLIRGEAEAMVRDIMPSPAPLRLYPWAKIPMETAVHSLAETISSTAAYLSHLQLGYLHIDEPMMKVAVRLFQRFLTLHNPLDCLALCILIGAHDDYQALNHYGRVREKQFLSGELHRPWIQYDLASEVSFLCELGVIQVVTADGERFIQLTEFGKSRYAATKQLLDTSGFSAQRALLMRWSQFSQLEDYDMLVEKLGDWSIRDKVLDFSQITAGMRVLELGCGTGALTMDTGLCHRVGQSGMVMATDPSIGMLARAKKKARERNITNVQFVQTAAEELPFDANSFDAVTGCSFLHFTDIPEVVRQVHRVAKPGAVFSTIFPLSFPHSNEFFGEWFKPVLRPGSSAKTDMLPSPEAAPAAMQGLFTDIEVVQLQVRTVYHDVESVVKFYVQVVNAFDEAMNELPWRARLDMVNHLIARGHRIVDTYSREQLMQFHPTQLIRGIVNK